MFANFLEFLIVIILFRQFEGMKYFIEPTIRLSVSHKVW